ncbi:MAG TPA: microcin ABC transporter ATP-binding protein [Rhodospirillaceae bacterium]|nr:MAG: microcin ABC transporter ATP-binding protein [Alphaproteobacteria bacterium GWF2_58_20]HAU29468.1 microcin ABC transporter ATP-binding protein [Rhodospirillaceae bacterium]
MSVPVLEVENLSVDFCLPGHTVHAVRGASFSVAKGETLAIVGESGSGKSVTALSILQLLPYPMAQHPSGSIRLRGEELMGAPEHVLHHVRGGAISMVFQEPMTSLNPLHSIERQVGETLRLHKGMSRKDARARTLELLELVGLPDVEKRLGSYPHELSGGQRQRVMIAMALANDPDVLIADEPTTALDVTVQAQILKLLKDLQRRLGMALILITHDLGIVRRVADKVCVMNNGEIVEAGEVAHVFSDPSHPYTKALLAAEPKGEALVLHPDAPEILRGEDIRVHFPIRTGLFRRQTGAIKAVDGVSLSVRAGETVGVVGESGSGKTTLGFALLRLLESHGNIQFEGQDISGHGIGQMRPLRKDMQIVFQDPFGSLSPRMSVGAIVGEGLSVHRIGKSREEREILIINALEEVGIDPEARHRYPHEFSGGQRQRISIARAMILKPKLVVLDEPTSALDVSVQAQVVDLLRGLQEKHGLAYVFISHDLRVVRAMASHILVMKDGRVVESGAVSEIFSHPQQDYTKELFRAAFETSRF